MKNKLRHWKDYAKRHKLSILIVCCVLVYAVARLIHHELHGTEILVEPMIEVAISRFIESGGTDV